MSTPTINQYLLDLFAKARLANGGTQAQYGNLKESEVVFSKFTKDEKTAKWATNITCKGRGWGPSKVTFTTGTLKAFIGNNLQSAGKLDSLARLATFPSIVFVDENQSIYLNVEKEANIFDSLQMTGYVIPTDAFNVILNKDFDMNTQSSGFVDIDHPIVTGRMLLRYINREPVAPVNPDPQKEEDKTSIDVEQSEPLSEEEQIEAMLKADAEKEATQANGENSEGDEPNPENASPEPEGDEGATADDVKPESEEPTDPEPADSKEVESEEEKPEEATASKKRK